MTVGNGNFRCCEVFGGEPAFPRVSESGNSYNHWVKWLQPVSLGELRRQVRVRQVLCEGNINDGQTSVVTPSLILCTAAAPSLTEIKRRERLDLGLDAHAAHELEFLRGIEGRRGCDGALRIPPLCVNDHDAPSPTPRWPG